MALLQKAKADEQITNYKVKIEKLESLCRALQSERSNLKKSLEEVKKSEVIEKDVSQQPNTDEREMEDATKLVPVEQATE